MQEILERIAKLRTHTKNMGDHVCNTLNLTPEISDPWSGCFAMIFNHSTLTLELLHYYHSIWNRTYTVTPRELIRIKEENGQRCMEALKWLFVSSLSSIEYSTKSVIAVCKEKSPAHDLLPEGRAYLSNIMRKSLKCDLITSNDNDDWQSIIFVRNCVVHNNGIADIDKECAIAGFKFESRAGKMMQGKLDFFLFLTEVGIERYYDWLQAVIKQRCV